LIVSDASPLIALSRIGYLQLLPTLYTRILIPPAVREDASRRGVSASDLDGASWLTLRAPRDAALVDELRHVEPLDLGESEAIALAAELGMRLILDERHGARVARTRGIPVFGVAHVIVEAARAGLIAIDEVEPLLRRMVASTFWLSERIIQLAIAQARKDA
jgi:predicted nucleic acid-binding protein